MELNGLPDGSRPIRVHNRAPTLRRTIDSVNTFEMLWMEKRSSASLSVA
jgi:hypothetical protein